MAGLALRASRAAAFCGLLTAASCTCLMPVVPDEEPAAPPSPIRVPAGPRRIQVVGDQFYADGVRLLVKASFYEYHPSGTNPWEVQPPPEVLRNQLRELKAAGFNAIRSFNITPQSVAICREEGVWVFVQFWIDQEKDFSDPSFRRANVDRLRDLVRGFREFDNIIAYLVINEPQLQGATTSAQIQALAGHLVEIRDTVRAEHPGVPIGFDNWPPSIYLDPAPWDFIAYNVYTWGPSMTSDRGMGYRPFLEYLKRTQAPDRPLIVLEYGTSVSPTERGGTGYGGWTEQGQADESMRMLRDILAVGCAGACYTHYADQIWKGGSNAERDDHPEEWFGMLAQDLNGGPAMEGRWRPVYYAHQELYRAVLLEPSPVSAVRGVQRVLLHSEAAEEASYRVDDGPWHPLHKNAGPWWVASLDTAALADTLHHIEVSARLPGAQRVVRDAWVVAANRRPDPYALDVRITPSSGAVEPGDPLSATITVRRADGSPAANRSVRWSVFEHRNWSDEVQTVTTGSDGRAQVNIQTANRLGVMTISAGAEVIDGPYRRRFGDLATVRVGVR